MSKNKVRAAIEEMLFKYAIPETAPEVRRTTFSLLSPREDAGYREFETEWTKLGAEAQNIVRQVVFSFQCRLVKVGLLERIGKSEHREVFPHAADVEAFSNWSDGLARKVGLRR